MTCTFPSCGRRVHGHGHCVAHYRQKTLGKPLTPLDYSMGTNPAKARSARLRPLLARVAAISRSKLSPLAQALSLGLASAQQLYVLRFKARALGMEVVRHRSPNRGAKRSRLRYERLTSARKCVTCERNLPEGETRRRCESCRILAERRRGNQTTMGERRIEVAADDRCPKCHLCLPHAGCTPSIYEFASQRRGEATG